MSQDKQKRHAAYHAASFIPEDCYIGVGTGSTVNFFIEALVDYRQRIRGAVTTSAATTERLKKVGIEVVSPTHSGRLPIYIDGADEVNHSLQMIKGGGGALLAEKIIAQHADLFICIVDEKKYTAKLGDFPLPVEVLPMARSLVAQAMVALGGRPEWRQGFVTEGGHEILDVHGLDLSEPKAMEERINLIPGVMENGLFARRPADRLIIGTDAGVREIDMTL